MIKRWTCRTGDRQEEQYANPQTSDQDRNSRWALRTDRGDRWFQVIADLCPAGLVACLMFVASVSDAADPPLSNVTQATKSETDGNDQAGARKYDTLRPIGTLTANIAPKQMDEAGKSLPLPENAARVEMAKLALQHHESGYSRPWSLSTYDWEPTALYHGPLYFEETSLERFGRELPLIQPFVSAAQFYTALPELPYKLGAQLPWDHLYALGYDRPGNCVPFEWELPPRSVRGVLLADVIITGLVFAIP